MALVVDDQGGDAAARFFTAVDQAVATSESETVRVAFDCEGVNLCRNGTVELVALCFEEPIGVEGAVFLVDLNDKGDASKRKDRVQALKQLFGCKDVQKVIHDSRMDCDALFHLHGISVVNVHDTSCSHFTETGRENVNLNDVLSYHGIAPNGSRDKTVYKNNPAFWATRPLTK